MTSPLDHAGRYNVDADGLRAVPDHARHASGAYVCIATWPGGHANPFSHRRKPMIGAVDFLDCALPHDLDRDEFDRLWDGSVERTGELLAETHDSPTFYRTVAFRLSAHAASAF
jgi:hypothetical protein